MDFALEAASSPRLLLAEGGCDGETRASWIQRLCGSHQYSFGRLSQISGIKPTKGDWDCEIDVARWRSLLAMAACSVDTCDEAIYGMTALSRRYPARSFLLYESQRPCSRWCTKCLASDAVPYLRWEWRLAAVKTCPVHQVLLSDRCPWCKSPLHIHRALLVASGPNCGVPNLATCGNCGMSLIEAMFRDQEDEEQASPSSELLDELLAQLKLGWREPSRQLELNFERYAATVQVQAPYRRLPDDHAINGTSPDLRSGSKHHQTTQASGRSTAAQDSKFTPLTGPQVNGCHRDWFWSDLVDLRDSSDPMRVNRRAYFSKTLGAPSGNDSPAMFILMRGKLARALRAIRSEINLLRADHAKFDRASCATAICADIAADKEFLSLLAQSKQRR